MSSEVVTVPFYLAVV